MLTRFREMASSNFCQNVHYSYCGVPWVSQSLQVNSMALSQITEQTFASKFTAL
jgi:hypothetical protein